MAIAIPKRTSTPEDLLLLPEGKHCELVDGELREREMGAESGWIAGRLATRLSLFIEQTGLGWVFPADVGYQCFPEDPDRVRKPDVSFVRAGRFPGDQIPRGHIGIPPDLAVEVVSPNDLFHEVWRKVEEYRRASVRLIWVVDPDARAIEIVRGDGAVSRLYEANELTGEDVLPGFRCRVGELFPPPPEEG
jgi:Uma2 family endonuclease